MIGSDSLKLVLAASFGLIFSLPTAFSQSVVWETQPYPEIEYRTFFDIEFNKQEKGIIVGLNGEVMYTDNGGAEWKVCEGTIITARLDEIQHLKKDEWLVGGSGLWRTVNGGATWELELPVSVNDIMFLDSLSGLIVCEDSVVLTADGCLTYKNITPDKGKGYNWSTGTLTKSGLVAITSSSDTVAFSTDGGLSWTYSVTEIEWFRDCAFVQHNRLLCLGHGGGGHRVIISSDDLGITWETTLFRRSATDYMKIDMIDSTIGFVGGPSGIAKTTDAGSTWHRVEGPGSSIYSISAINRDTLFAVGDSIYRTNDAALTSVADKDQGESSLSKVYPNPSTDLLVVETANTQSEILHVNLCSLQGQTLVNQNCNGQSISIDVGLVPSGSYLLTVSNCCKTETTLVQVLH